MHIALVEESPGDVRWFQNTLAQIDPAHHLTIFETGLRALSAFRESSPPDCIITNWRFPILTLQEFVSEVRAISGYAAIPVAVLTGMADLLGEEASALGAIGCLQKPVTPQCLKGLLDQISPSTPV